jgi:predicted transcriptional regulator of viral defense system
MAVCNDFAEPDVLHRFSHMPRKTSSLRLSAYLDALQGRGRYTFDRAEALKELGSTPEALEAAVRRLAAKGRLAVPRRGFYVIVPAEYRSAGAPPADWFIADLMRFEGQPYYVGLLSAAALHGSAHQQPQEFQVVTDGPLRPARAGRVLIRFFTKATVGSTPVVDMKTQTGSMRVSTPEATALDLVRYVKRAGHLDNVATILSELAEKLDPRRLLAVARQGVEIAHVQRLGHLLDAVGAASAAKPMAAWISGQRPRRVLLRPGAQRPIRDEDPRWRVSVNEQVEIDR